MIHKILEKGVCILQVINFMYHFLKYSLNWLQHYSGAIGIFVTIYIAWIGKKLTENQKIENMKVMRDKVKKIQLSIDMETMIQLRNYRMKRNPKFLFRNSYKLFSGITRISANLLKIDELGIWVDLYNPSSEIKHFVKDNNKYSLSCYIPYDWIKIVDEIDKDGNSEFTHSNERYIFYIKAPWFMFPYKTQYLLKESVQVEKLTCKKQKSIEEPLIREGTQKEDLDLPLEREIRKVARKNRWYYAYKIKNEKIK